MFARLELHPSGVFLTRPNLIGASEEEIAAGIERRLPEARYREIEQSFVIAARSLEQRAPWGTC